MTKIDRVILFALIWILVNHKAIARISISSPAIDAPTSKDYHQGKPDDEEQNLQWCLDAMRDVAPHYRYLSQLHHIKADHKVIRPIYELIKFQVDDCQSVNSRKRIRHALAFHSNRIGILLPYSYGRNRTFTTNVVDAVKNFYSTNQVDLRRRIIVKDTKNQPKIFEQKLSELVFKHQVSLLIGGATKSEAQLLEKWAEKLQIATIILHQDTDPDSTPKQVFYVSPDIQQMTDSIFQFIHQRGVKKLAILSPVNHSDPLTMAVQNRIESSKKIEMTSHHYRPNDYQSMEAAVRKLFRIDDPDRQEELKLLLEEKKKLADENESTIDSRSLILPPIVEIDAIYIDDHFRAVRHFVNIFKYLKVPKMTLIGNQKWRAPELLNPPEKFLDESFFFDYIGSYNKLPNGIQAPIYHSEFFTTPEDVSSIDIKIITTHALQLAEQVVTRTNLRRDQIHQFLKTIKNHDDPFFKPGYVFNPNQVSQWPTFLFSLAPDSLRLIRHFSEIKLIPRQILSPMNLKAADPMQLGIAAPLNGKEQKQ